MPIKIIGHTPSHLKDLHPQTYTDVTALIAEISINDLVILTNNEALAIQQLQLLRQHLVGSQVLIFSTLDPQNTQLCDGDLSADINQQYNQYLQRLTQMNIDIEEASLSEKLIAYLWLNPARRLTPSFTNQQWKFTYPLLDRWQVEAPQAWLNSLLTSKVISQDKLHNRIRQCKQCDSSALNYIDTCPSCHSIDIANFIAMHCFSCGHVAGQQEFKTNHALNCPNCHTQLRHIGVDYDRPIENHHCNDCSTMFSEGEVKAHCLSCGHSNELSELKEKSIYSYQLTEQGELWARTGRELTIVPQGIGEPVSLEHFRWLAQWQNRLAQRHNSTHLVMAINFTNLSELYATYSDAEVIEKQNEFFKRFQSLIRQTDVMTHWRSDLLVFLLVHCSQQHIDTLQAKIEKLSEEQNDNPLELAVSYTTLPNPDANDDMQNYLERIIAEME